MISADRNYQVQVPFALRPILTGLVHLSHSTKKYDSWRGEPPVNSSLTHWGRVTHICVSDLTIIGSDNGLSPGRHQAIIRTNAGILLIRPLGTNFSEILIEILIFSFKKMRLKVSSGKCRPFCLGLNVLKGVSNVASISMSWCLQCKTNKGGLLSWQTQTLKILTNSKTFMHR